MKKKDTQSVVLCMTDLHYGKKTPTFNQDKFAELIDKLAVKLEKMRERQSHTPVDELVICMLGDINDGTEIYRTQPHHQVETNVEIQAEEISEILAPFFLAQKKIWGKIRLECVPGNHGRAGWKSHDWASWDTVTYKYLRGKMGDKIKVNMNSQSINPFLRKTQIHGHDYLLYHGHDILINNGIPWYGIWQRVAKWNLTKAIGSFDAVMMGHFHSYADNELNRVRILLNGTLVTDDDWPVQTLGREGANKWHIFGVTDEEVISWQHALDLL